jgi:phosphoglucomutase
MAAISPLTGKPAPASVLVNVTRLINAYYSHHLDPSVTAQRVVFGTSGHRGSSLDGVVASGWFAARPWGTENIYKIYAESFRDQAHLDAIVTEARAIVNTALGASAPSRGSRGERP